MKLFLASEGMGGQGERLRALVGEGVRVLVVSNAKDTSPSERRAMRVEKDIAALEALGMQAHELDLRRYFGHETALTEAVRACDMVWVMGGNTFVLRRAMVASGFDKGVRDMIAKGDVAYAGYSAGIVVASPTLRGIERLDKPDHIPEGYDERVEWRGLGLVPYGLVPHYDSPRPDLAAAMDIPNDLRMQGLWVRTLTDEQVIVVGEPDAGVR